MATAVKQFHEEEAIGKAYDSRLARRLLGYLRPYLRLLAPALALTLTLNGLNVLQPKFTQWAIDWHIIPARDGAATFDLAFRGLVWLALAALGVRLLVLLFVKLFDCRRHARVIRKPPRKFYASVKPAPAGGGSVKCSRRGKWSRRPRAAGMKK